MAMVDNFLPAGHSSRNGGEWWFTGFSVAGERLTLGDIIILTSPPLLFGRLHQPGEKILQEKGW